MAKIAVQKITPFLWFNHDAQKAVKFYTSIFKNSKILRLAPLVSTFELAGQRFMAINGGPQFKFTEAVSFLVSCKTQKEIDYFWKALASKGGKPVECGWLKDRFGLSWQIVPEILGQLIGSPDPRVSKRVLDAVLKMKKIEIEGLKRAARG